MEDVYLSTRTPSTPGAQLWQVLVHHYNHAAYLARYQATEIHCFPKRNPDITGDLYGLVTGDPNQVRGSELGGDGQRSW